MIIRPATQTDLKAILTIEQQTFISPWTEAHFLYELTGNPYASLLVAEVDTLLVGYVDFWITFQQAQINNLAVLPSLKRKKIGTTLLVDALDRIHQSGCHHVTLEVRVSNLAAQQLYQQHGFKIIVTKKHYYENGEDAYLMEKTL